MDTIDVKDVKRIELLSLLEDTKRSSDEEESLSSDFTIFDVVDHDIEQAIYGIGLDQAMIGFSGDAAKYRAILDKYATEFYSGKIKNIDDISNRAYTYYSNKLNDACVLYDGAYFVEHEDSVKGSLVVCALYDKFKDQLHGYNYLSKFADYYLHMSDGKSLERVRK
jgi:hypothetical protein